MLYIKQLYIITRNVLGNYVSSKLPLYPIHINRSGLKCTFVLQLFRTVILVLTFLTYLRMYCNVNSQLMRKCFHLWDLLHRKKGRTITCWQSPGYGPVSCKSTTNTVKMTANLFHHVLTKISILDFTESLRHIILSRSHSAGVLTGLAGIQDTLWSR